jgi:hypothetical protein
MSSTNATGDLSAGGDQELHTILNEMNEGHAVVQAGLGMAPKSSRSVQHPTSLPLSCKLLYTKST